MGMWARRFEQSWPRRALRDRSGVAAVEFAIITPLLLLLYMGGTEVTLAVMLHRKVEHAVAAVTDLTTQVTAINKAELDGIFNVAAEILQPYDAAKLGLKIDAVRIDAAGKARVEWSYVRNMTASAKGSEVALGAGYSGLRDAFLVTSKIGYQYLPMGGYGFKDPIDMGGTATFRPRTGTEVQCSDCS